MKRILILLLFLFFGLMRGQHSKSKTQTTTKPRCATSQHEVFLQNKHPKRLSQAAFENWLQPLTKKAQNQRESSESNGIITIPVVVHVVHSGQNIGVAPNITDAQVISQIKVLNEDFRKLQSSPGYNNSAVGADIQVQFELAKEDPIGNPTNGINRVKTCEDAWSRVEFDEVVKPATIWNPEQYMNIWTAQLADVTLLGYAQYPDASSLDGLDATNGMANSDGVVASYNVFGSLSYDDGSFLLNSRYNKGRTMTHEVGHFFGLRHIWGDEDCGTDFCADTPVHHTENYGCPTVKSCASNQNEMVENYMDYTDDSCMNIFTQNQKDRIIAVLNNSPRRKNLRTSTKNSAIALFANDAELKLETTCATSLCGVVPEVASQKITLYNRGNNNLTSATIQYKFNSNANKTYSWTGNLAPNSQALISLVADANTAGTFTASIATANGVTDARSGNNSVSGNFLVPILSPNYTMNDFIFTLQRDETASETTWNLQDDEGNVLYSGGPYEDAEPIPAVLTENWTLDSNKCYIFTINDIEGDGICCRFGKGYYNIKAANSDLIIASGTSFGSTDIKRFSINLEGIAASGESFILHPNPVAGVLNIKTPSNLGVINNYKIINTLGQVVQSGTVVADIDVEIDVVAFHTGVYFISIEKNNVQKTIKFLKK